MSILIKDMVKPTSCGWCRFEGGGYCFAAGEKILHVGKREDVHPDCPLIEIKPHGRLIDADDLDKMLKFIGEAETQIYGRNSWRFVNKCRQAIEDAPTVIPAEEVYADGYDTAGNYHWIGTHTGEHVIPVDREEQT